MNRDEEILSISPLLLGLAEEDVGRLAEFAELRTYGDGELVVEEGTPSDCLFILKEGEVQVEKGSGKDVVILASFSQAGDFFGEMSLIDIMPRSAHIRTCGPAAIWAFPKKELTACFTQSPRAQMTMILNIARNLSLRLRDADTRIVDLMHSLDAARGS